ncbi:hypothetical protein C8F01DRAFT_1093762 [Mycena amicta]|nr:hypothetical protein C8F01DRAFT_1093762 [Mycena amicta]
MPSNTVYLARAAVDAARLLLPTLTTAMGSTKTQKARQSKANKGTTGRRKTKKSPAKKPRKQLPKPTADDTESDGPVARPKPKPKRKVQASTSVNDAAELLMSLSGEKGGQPATMNKIVDRALGISEEEGQEIDEELEAERAEAATRRHAKAATKSIETIDSTDDVVCGKRHPQSSYRSFLKFTSRNHKNLVIQGSEYKKLELTWIKSSCSESR